MSVILKKAHPTDAAWISRFQIAMAHETEGIALDPATVEHGVANVFQTGVGFYLTAKKANDPIGCLLILKEWSDWRNGDVWWIHSVYIRPEFRKQGIFKMMFEEVRRLGHQEGCRGLRLYVDKSNQNAQQVYKNLGMNNKHYELFELMF